MRLIDADALPVVAECCMDEAGYLAKFNVVHEEDIKKAPTIEAEPVKHGEWKIVARDMSTHTVLVECTECYALLEIPMTDFGLNYNYCPNCGAIMDGGDAG